MALTIDATVGGETSNSYATLEEIEELLEAEILVGAWADLDDDEEADLLLKQKALIQATRLIDQVLFKGVRTNQNQALEFPRTGVRIDPNMIIPSAIIPHDIKLAQALICVDIVNRTSDPTIANMSSLSGVYRINVDDAELWFNGSLSGNSGVNQLPLNAQYYIKKYALAAGQSPIGRG
jgi:hypothetical protein